MDNHKIQIAPRNTSLYVVVHASHGAVLQVGTRDGEAGSDGAPHAGSLVEAGANRVVEATRPGKAVDECGRSRHHQPVDAIDLRLMELDISAMLIRDQWVGVSELVRVQSVHSLSTVAIDLGTEREHNRLQTREKQVQARDRSEGRSRNRQRRNKS